MRVSERMGRLPGSTNTLKRQRRLPAAGVQHALNADDQGFVRTLLQPCGQPLLGSIQVAIHESRNGVKPKSVPASRFFSNPGLTRCFRSRKIAAIKIQELEIVAPGLRIRPPRTPLGGEGFFESPDVHTNGADPVVSTFIIRLRSENFFQRLNGFAMLEVLRRAPEDK